jgi:hypothetical protein
MLMYVYSIDTATVASVLGLSSRSLGRWHMRFRATRNVLKDQPRAKASRRPREVCEFVRQYVHTIRDSTSRSYGTKYGLPTGSL